MATKQQKGSGNTTQKTDKSEKTPSVDEINAFFDGGMKEVASGGKAPVSRTTPVHVPSTPEVNTAPVESYEPPDTDSEDDDASIEKIVAEQNRAHFDDIADELAMADEKTVVYRSKYKGHYISLDAGYMEEYMNAGVLRKRQAKVRCQFKMNLFATDNEDTIKALDTYIAKFKRRGGKCNIQRLDDYNRLQRSTVNVDTKEVAENMDFETLKEIYEKRQREISGHQKIKKGTITT